MSSTLDPSAIRTGRVRGRYFRENFAQGGLELVQMIPELVTNADAAIEAWGVRTDGSGWRSARRMPSSKRRG